MSNGNTQESSPLNDCGCCAGVSQETPATIYNTPGLSAIRYRIGTYSQFKSSMQANLSNARYPQLAALKVRHADDLALAVLDVWAVAEDILTFYQERIANESYLRTASERFSVLQLVRNIGYELRPGVAASTYLAFSLDDTAATQTTIDVGTRVQSIPNPGEQPQTFETIAPIPAHSAWNTMRPRLTQRHPYKDANGLRQTFYFAGILTGLQVGDAILLIPDDDHQPVLCRTSAVTPQPDLNRTRVDLYKDGQPWQAPTAHAASSGVQLMMRVQDGLADDLNPGRGTASNRTSQYFHQPVKAVDLNAISLIERFPILTIFNNFFATQAPPPGALVFRSRASLFGHNAPQFEALPSTLTVGEFVWDSTNNKSVFQPGVFSTRKKTWADDTLSDYLKNGPLLTSAALLYLDSSYPGIANNSYLALRQGNTWSLHQVTQAIDTSYADFTLSGKVTQLTLDNDDGFSTFTIRGTTVYAQSERLSLARLPIPDPISGSTLDLDGSIVGLYSGQGLLVSGELDTDRGNTACEYVTIQDIVYLNDDEGYSRITLAGNGLQYSYVRTTVTIYGNVAPATHGETRQEILGSGDASVAFQRFSLRQTPLTFISATTASGVHSSLHIYVNDILWQEVPFFYGHSPTEHIYITRTSDDGKTTVQFGDGITGARVPSGPDNVRAVYRTGIGLSGRVKARQLSLLLSRPAGLKDVTNPQDATGAANPEQRDEARQNATLPVLTLDRIVSLRDYEDFAHAFTGIAKALATCIWDGQRKGIFLTIAGPQGAAIPADSQLYNNLVTAIQQASNQFIPLVVRTYRQRFFRIVGTVQIASDYLPKNVQQSLETTLHNAFSFEARSFGQPVSLSEVMATIQAVKGVVAANVTALYRSYPAGQEAVQRNDLLPAALPQAGSGLNASAAELLTLDPGPLDLVIM